MSWQAIAHYSAEPGMKQSIDNGVMVLGLNPYASDLINQYQRQIG